MTWWQALPAMLTAAALLFLPGLVFSYAAGARRFMSLASAPLCSTGLVGASAIVGGFLGIRWNFWFFVAFTLASTGCVWLIRRLMKRRFAPSASRPALTWTHVLLLAIALLIPAVLIARWLFASIGDFNGFSQAYDNTFHLNAIQYILQTGNASSLTLSQMISPGSTYAVYPSAWHSLAALTASISQVDVFVAENAMTVAVCALVWPLSCIALVRAAVSSKPLPAIAGGIMAAGFAAFPFQLVERGPLFPNLLSYAILPLVVVVVAGLVGALKENPLDKFALTVLILVGTLALFTAQPNGFTALMAISIPLLGGLWLRSLLRSVSSRAGTLRIGTTVFIGVATSAAFAFVWKSLLIPYQQWQPTRSIAESAVDVLSGGLLGGPPSWASSFLVVAGFVTIAVNRRGYWIAGGFMIVGFLYMVAASAPSGQFRHFIVGSWYEDTPRLAALVPMFIVVLAAVGIDGITQAAASTVRATSFSIRGLPAFSTIPLTSATAPTVAVFLALTTLSASPADEPVSSFLKAPPLTPPISENWNAHDTTLLSLDEYTLLQRIHQTVPDDAVIAVNPFNGGSLAFAVSGRKVTQYNLTASGPGQDLAALATNLAYELPKSDVCRDARDRNIRYILDFGPSYIGFHQAALLYPGFVNVGSSPYVTLEDREGDAKLYELTGCYS